MPDRMGRVSLLWAASLLALLALVQVAPIRMSGAVAFTSGPDCIHQELATLPGPSAAHIRVAMVSETEPRLDALLTEVNEENEADALEGARSPFASPLISGNISDRRLIAPLPVLSRYPLRC